VGALALTSLPAPNFQIVGAVAPRLMQLAAKLTF